jgi:hypothetical protein
VRSVSAKALEYLGHHAVGMLGRPVARLLPAARCRALQRVPLCNPAPVLLQTAQPQPDAAGWDALEVQAHRADEGIVVELLRPTARLALRDRSMCLRTLAGPGRRGRQPVPRRAPRAAWPKPAAMTASWSFPPT